MSQWHARKGLLALALMAAGAANAAAVYTETEWSSVVNAGTAIVPTPGTTSSFSLSNAGHPGAALQFNTSVTVAANGSNASTGVAFSPNVAHDGAAAPVQMLSWSVDALWTGATSTGHQSFLIGQQTGGVTQLFVYQAPVSGLQQGVWHTTESADLEAADFVLVDLLTGELDAALHPDFSAAMVFGFGTGLTVVNNSNSAETVTATIRYDNFTVTVTPLAPPNPNAVPLPATPALALLGLGLAAATRQRRRR